MFIWRPIAEGVVTYTEVSTILSLDDLIKINAVLDMKRDLKQSIEGE